MSERVTALIPVKVKSGRLPHKNILPFGESTLLEHKIKQLKDCEAVSDIIVSPDSDKMLKMAEAQGVEAWKRTEKYNLDEVPFGESVEYICKQLSSSHVLWACCASPLVDEQVYGKGIFDRATSTRRLDNTIRNYLTEHNPAQQGLVCLYSPYRGIAIFSLFIALLLDIAAFVTGFIIDRTDKADSESVQESAGNYGGNIGVTHVPLRKET